MPALTRRLDAHRPNCWHIYFDDLHVGTIDERPGVPKHQDQWAWRCGMFGVDSQWKHGEGPDFEACRAAFQIAWDQIRPTLSEEQCDTWRRQRDWTDWKYRMRDAGLPLPTQSTAGRSRCFCGAEITIASLDGHVKTAHKGIGA